MSFKHNHNACQTSLPYEANITALSHEGRGIASIQGKRKFLRGALPQEKVIAIDTHRHNTYDEGEVQQILEASVDRITPLCPYVGYCGGCTLQHMHSERQIQFKQTVLLEQLTHLGHLKTQHIQWLAPLTGPTFGYRYKARLGVKYVTKKQKVLVGFHEIKGRYLADIDHCIVLHPLIGKNLNTLGQLVHSLEAYQSIPQIEVAIGDEIVALIFRHLYPLSTEDLLKLGQFSSQIQIRIYLQSGGIDTIQPLKPTDPLWLHYTLPEHAISLQFYPADFTQINPYINQKMVTQAIQLLEPKAHESLLDLFCGIGNFTLPLSRYCLQVAGVEGDSQLVARAKQNAQQNNCLNTAFYTINLATDFSKADFMQKKFDKILLDPPRTGALVASQLLPLLKPERILYISCNPATLARDANLLSQQGYRLTQAGVIDMFPHTSHVESMALFLREST